MPEDILMEIFKDMSGSDLIELTGVCRGFNQLIGKSPNLMNRIRFKVESQEVHSFTEADEVLNNSVRSYKHLSLYDLKFEKSQFPEYLKGPNRWQSMKLSTCVFGTAHDFAAFISLMKDTLEEADIKDIQIACGETGGDSTRLTVPNLRKLKCGNQAHIICPTLKVFEMQYGIDYARAVTILRSNPFLEELTMLYEGIQGGLFTRRLLDIGVRFHLKKLRLTKAPNSFQSLTSVSP